MNVHTETSNQEIVATEKRRRVMDFSLRNNLFAWLFLIPHLALYVCFMLYPIFKGFYISLHQWTIGREPVFIGFENYAYMFKDKNFWEALWNTLYFVILSTPALVIVGLLLALIVNAQLKGTPFLRSAIFLPHILSITVISSIWVFMLQPYTGFVNSMLHKIGITTEIFWLDDVHLAWISILIVTIWWTVGFNMVLYLAGLQEISEEYYEAARIDGANGWQCFWHITLPSLKGVTLLIVVLQSIVTPPYTLENFKFITESASIWRWTLNSVYIAIVTTVATLIVTSLAAFALSRIPFKGKKRVFWIIVAGLMVPTEATIVPLFLMMVENGLINSYSSIILPSIAAPLGVLILKQFYDNIPKELVEAATIDGAGLFRIYWSIFLPLSRSSMAALAIFTFISSWNNFLWPYLAITSEEMMTLPVGIPLFQSAYTGELTRPMAANMLASLPALIVFILFQRHIIKGITMTGIKG